jgi:hypothetical protein
VIKIFSAFNGSLIDLKSASHPWGSSLLVVALRALLLVFFVGVVFFVWVVLILFFKKKSRPLEVLKHFPRAASPAPGIQKPGLDSLSVAAPR